MPGRAALPQDQKIRIWLAYCLYRRLYQGTQREFQALQMAPIRKFWSSPQHSNPAQKTAGRTSDSDGWRLSLNALTRHTAICRPNSNQKSVGSKVSLYRYFFGLFIYPRGICKRITYLQTDRLCVNMTSRDTEQAHHG